MKYILLIALIVAAGYYYHRQSTAESNARALALLIEKVEYQDVDLFALKEALAKRVYAICANNEAMLLESGRSVGNCMEGHDIKRVECEGRIFRLAPLSISNRSELLDYSKRYVRCALPYDDLRYQSY